MMMMPDINTPLGYAIAFALAICLPAVVLLVAVVGATAALPALRTAPDALARARFHAQADRTWRAAERQQACRDTQATMLLAALTVPNLSMGAGGDPRGALLATQWAVGAALRETMWDAEMLAREEGGAS